MRLNNIHAAPDMKRNKPMRIQHRMQLFCQRQEHALVWNAYTNSSCHVHQMAPPVTAANICDKRFTGQSAVMQVFYATPCAWGNCHNQMHYGLCVGKHGRVMPRWQQGQRSREGHATRSEVKTIQSHIVRYWFSHVERIKYCTLLSTVIEHGCLFRIY